MDRYSIFKMKVGKKTRREPSGEFAKKKRG